MTGLPDPDASRAVLIGVHQYETLDALPAVERNLTGLRDVFTDPALWGLPESNCVLVSQPHSSRAVLDALWEATGQASDALIVYYAGHGLTDPHTDELCLALPDSDPERSYTALTYESVRRVVLGAGGQAIRKVVILDCCYSGRALVGGMSASSQVADQAVVDGTYLLTASAETRKALAPPGEPYTAFTGELISTLTKGVPNGPDLLDMETVYRRLRTQLTARSRPVPQQRNRNAGGLIALVRNTAVQVDPEPPPARVRARPVLEDVYEGFAAVASPIASTLGPSPDLIGYTGRDGDFVTTTDPAVICETVVVPGGRAAAVGAELARSLVRGMRADWSDGAATAAVMAQEMMRRIAFEIVPRGQVPSIRLGADLVEGGVRAAQMIRARSAEVDSLDRLTRALTAATGNPEDAEVLARAVNHVGREGVIQVERRLMSGRDLETHDGLFLPVQGVYSGQRLIFHEPLLVLLAEPPGGAPRVPGGHEDRPVLFLSPDAGALVLETRDAGGLGMRVKADDPIGTLDDIALLTGAGSGRSASPVVVPQITAGASGLHIEHDYRYDSADLSQRIDELRSAAAGTRDPAERARLRFRMARLAGGVATVWLGRESGESRAVYAERVDTLARARDGLPALIEHGTVDGGGLALNEVGTTLLRELSGPAATILCEGLWTPFRLLANAHEIPREPIADSAAVIAGAVTTATTAVRRFLDPA